MREVGGAAGEDGGGGEEAFDLRGGLAGVVGGEEEREYVEVAVALEALAHDFEGGVGGGGLKVAD